MVVIEHKEKVSLIKHRQVYDWLRTLFICNLSECCVVCQNVLWVIAERMAPVSCIKSLQWCIWYNVSCLAYLVSCLMSHISCLMSTGTVFCLTSHVSCLTSHVQYIYCTWGNYWKKKNRRKNVAIVCLPHYHTDGGIPGEARDQGLPTRTATGAVTAASHAAALSAATNHHRRVRRLLTGDRQLGQDVIQCLDKSPKKD